MRISQKTMRNSTEAVDETTLDNVSAMAAAYLREKELGETGAFEKAYPETVGENKEEGNENTDE
jgi:hypothetical protein